MFFQIKWVHLLVFSILLLVGASISSFFRREAGSYTDFTKYVISEDVLLKDLRSGEQPENESKGESIARKCLETLFLAKFPNKRPDSLKNESSGRNLELDCYNEELGIAVEYQGIQHYKYVPFFHKTAENFYKQVERDRMKLEMCRAQKITLITIPYNLRHEKICNYIVSMLQKHGKLPR